MSFTWPLALIGLVVPVALLAFHRWSLRRRRKQAVRYSSVALLRSVVPARRRWQRHLPIALLLLGLTAIGVAAARPQVERDVPYGRTSIILALDVSGSMCSTDVEPNRLSVAQEAARQFVESQPKGLRMALVAFSGFAQLAVPPTDDRDSLVEAIDALTTGRGTAIGGAILESLDAISEINPEVQPVGDAPEEPTAAGSAAPGAGGYAADIVVVLTDGRNTRGIEPLDAVPYAVERRVRVYTIGFGTESPGELVCTREQIGAGAFDPSRFGGRGGGGFPGGGGFGGFLVADNETLQEVAKRTGGTFNTAESAKQLQEVFAELPRTVATQRKPTEITWWLAALGALLAAGAVGASMRWSPYP
jgi:Ca-activated chloride channel family protein